MIVCVRFAIAIAAIALPLLAFAEAGKPTLPDTSERARCENKDVLVKDGKTSAKQEGKLEYAPDYHKKCLAKEDARNPQGKYSGVNDLVCEQQAKLLLRAKQLCDGQTVCGSISYTDLNGIERNICRNRCDKNCDYNLIRFQDTLARVWNTQQGIPSRPDKQLPVDPFPDIPTQPGENQFQIMNDINNYFSGAYKDVGFPPTMLEDSRDAGEIVQKLLDDLSEDDPYWCGLPNCKGVDPKDINISPIGPPPSPGLKNQLEMLKPEFNGPCGLQCQMSQYRPSPLWQRSVAQFTGFASYQPVSLLIQPVSGSRQRIEWRAIRFI